jgi:Ca2+-binding EF-hand superfamily protein
MKTLTLLPLAAAALLLAAPASHAEGKHAQRQDLLKAMDKNGDGKISKDEYLAVFAERFAKIDKNGDGYLTDDERRAARAAFAGKMHRRGGHRASPDGNNDGNGAFNE